VEPAELARGQGRKLRVQVLGGREDRAGHVLLPDAVAADHQGQQLERALEDFFRGVGVNGGRPADSAAWHNSLSDARKRLDTRLGGRSAKDDTLTV